MSSEQDPRQWIEGNYNAQAYGDSTVVINVVRHEWHVPSRPLDTEVLNRAHQRLKDLPVENVARYRYFAGGLYNAFWN